MFSLIGFSITAELFKFAGQQRRAAGFNPQRLSSWMIHTGLILLALGVFASKSYEFSDFQSMQIEESVTSGGYQLEYRGIAQEMRADYLETQAELLLSQNETHDWLCFPLTSTNMTTVSKP